MKWETAKRQLNEYLHDAEFANNTADRVVAIGKVQEVCRRFISLNQPKTISALGRLMTEQDATKNHLF